MALSLAKVEGMKMWDPLGDGMKESELSLAAKGREDLATSRPTLVKYHCVRGIWPQIV